MQTVISILSYLGLTHDKILPVLVIGVLLHMYLTKLLEPIKKSLESMKDNILVIVTYLSSDVREKLDLALIRQMSPLQIQPQGFEVLKESGFALLLRAKQIFEGAVNEFTAIVTTFDDELPEI